MGKAVAIVVVLIVACLIIWTTALVIVQVVYRTLWRHAKRAARWEPHTEMVGNYTAAVTVRRVAKVFGTTKVLAQFDPELISITGLGDPRLLDACARAQEQADINNAVGLREQ